MRTNTETFDVWKHTTRDLVAVVTGVVTPEVGEPQVFLRDLETGDPLQFTDQDMYYQQGFEYIGSWLDDRIQATLENQGVIETDPEQLVADNDLPAVADGKQA